MKYYAIRAVEDGGCAVFVTKNPKVMIVVFAGNLDECLDYIRAKLESKCS